MRTKKISGLEIQVPDTKAFTIKTPPNLPQMHGVTVAVAKRGGGKTVSIMNYLKQLQDAGCLDRLFIISPTIYSNKHILDMVQYDPEDVYEEPSKESLDAVIDAVNKEAEDYEEYIEQMKIYKKWLKYQQTGKGVLKDEDIFEIWNPESNMIEEPKHKYNGKKPVMLLFLDDCQNSQLFQPKSRLANVVIRHRHLGQLRKSHGALGLSLIFAVQSYKSIGGGLPRCVRGQATTMMVFKSKDEQEIKDIADECGGEVTEETFRKVYAFATDEPHAFLFIDFHKKENHPSMFRKRFDTFIIPEEIEAEAEKNKDNK